MMLSFIVKRIFQSVLVLLVVGLVAFSMFRFVGDPVDSMLGQERTVQDIENLREALGLNKPFFLQYWDFLVRAVQGDLGISYRQGAPVAEIIAARLPATLELAVVSGVIALGLGIVLGIFTAIRRDGVLANMIMATSLIGVSLPTFLIGVLLIYGFGVGLDIRIPFTEIYFNTGGMPTFGRGDTVDLGGWTTGFATWDGIQSIILPAITLGLYQMTLIMRLVRAEMLEVLRADYIRFARARGLSRLAPAER